VIPLPKGKFKVILCDPPYGFNNWSTKAQGASCASYKTMSVPGIVAWGMKELPPHMEDNCALFLWCPWPMVAEGVHTSIMSNWGFRPVTCAFNWVKTYRNGTPIVGMGFYTRSATEVCMLGIRGRMPRKSTYIGQLLDTDEGLPIHIKEERRKHSQKPEGQYVKIERLFDGPYLELFARERRKGWKSWGDQLPEEKK
jgi:N6-adenosine-specific RNA methylase IME4